MRLFLLWLVLWPCLASAQVEDVRAAKRHFEAGADYYSRGAYQDAIREFQAAYDLSKRPDILFNMAQAEDKLGDDAEVIRYLSRYLEEKTNANDRVAVQAWIDRLRARQPAPSLGPAPPPTSTLTPPSSALPQSSPGSAPSSSTPAPPAPAPVTTVRTDLVAPVAAISTPAPPRPRADSPKLRWSSVALAGVGIVMGSVAIGFAGAAQSSAGDLEGYLNHAGKSFDSTAKGIQSMGENHALVADIIGTIALTALATAAVVGVLYAYAHYAK